MFTQEVSHFILCSHGASCISFVFTQVILDLEEYSGHSDCDLNVTETNEKMAHLHSTALLVFRLVSLRYA